MPVQTSPLLRLTGALGARAQAALGWLRWGAARSPVRLALFAAVSLCAAWVPLGQVGAANDFYDTHLVQPYEEAAVRTVLEYRQLPLWNPWVCGGTYAPGGPYARFDSPAFALSLAFGARRAEGLILWLLLLLGMEGAFRWTRFHTGSALAALAVAPAFALNGFFGVCWSLGWIIFVGFELVPWALLGAARVARGEAAGIGLLAASFALMLGFGGTYPVPLCAVACALEWGRGLWQSRARGRWPAIAWLSVAAALFTAGASAFRLWPVLETMGAVPRVMAGAPAHSLEEMMRMAFWPASGGGGTDAVMYVGPALLPLAAAAVWARRRPLWPVAFLALLVWLASGYAPRPWPVAFAYLRELPIFGSLRYPERFLIPASLFFVECAAVGLAFVLAVARRGRRRRAWALGAAGMVLAAVVNWGLQVKEFGALAERSTLVAPVPRVDQPFAQSRGNRWAQTDLFWINRGSIACGEAFPVPMSERLRGDAPQEEYLADATAGTARRVLWSPNRIDVDVDATRPTELWINQNWHPGWLANVGEVVSRDGLLAVKLPAGHQRVSLRFWPRSAMGGWAVSALAVCLWVWLTRRGRRASPGQWAAAGTVPLAAALLIRVAWAQGAAPVPIRNPDGEQVLVGAVPANAASIHARFDAPVELVAAAISPQPDPDGVVHLDLYWRVDGPVSRAVGIFTHADGPNGGFKTADHEVLSGTYFFQNAPRGQLIRDDAALSAHDYEPGTWTVRVGLWNVSGDGNRIPVRDGAGQRPAEDRLPIGTFQVPPRPDAGTDAGGAP